MTFLGTIDPLDFPLLVDVPYGTSGSVFIMCQEELKSNLDFEQIT